MLLKKKNKYNVAVAGATGTVGREMVEILEERDFPVSDLLLFGSERAEGERIEFRGKNIAVKRLHSGSFSGVDIAFFSVGDARSREFVPAAVLAGAIVIDDSSAFRMDPKVPLVVPEVNAYSLAKHSGIIANPDSVTIGLVMVLKPLQDLASIKRVIVTTFQSVSGSGKEAMDELAGQTVALLNFREVEKKAYPYQIAFNCIPHIDAFLDNGSTIEEAAITNETRKILEDEKLRVTATSVRVPVFRCDAGSINIETGEKIAPNEARAVFAKAPGVMVYDDPEHDIYPLQIDVVGKDEVYIGRIRTDETVTNGLNLWVVSDNIRKGSALNVVQIAEHLIREHQDI
jgi:aspartate-semialdehyde dehydrogenase